MVEKIEEEVYLIFCVSPDEAEGYQAISHFKPKYKKNDRDYELEELALLLKEMEQRDGATGIYARAL
jgi:hypothetical protein